MAFPRDYGASPPRDEASRGKRLPPQSLPIGWRRLTIAPREMISILQFVIYLYSSHRLFLICGIIPVTNRSICQRGAAHARKE